MDEKPNPKRVAAGRRNRSLAGPLSEAGRAALREAVEKNRPWSFSTGPKTPEGKRRSSANGRTRQSGPISGRELRRDQAAARELIASLIGARRAAE